MQNLQKNKEIVDKDTAALGISVDSVPSKTARAESVDVKDVELLADFEPKGGAV